MIEVDPDGASRIRELLYDAMSFLTTPDGVRLRVTDRGAGDRTIVLVHGWKLSHRPFDHAIMRLSRAHRVVAFDLRGMGESDKPNSRYDFDELAGDLAFVLDELEVDDVTLVGWSMGCSVALTHMLHGARRVGRLVLINGPIRLARTADDSFPWSMTEDVLEGYFSDMEQHWPSRERAFITDSLYEPGTDLVNVLFAITQQAPLDGLMRVVRNQAKLDFRDLLPEIEVPVLAIYGRHDPYYPVALGEWIAEQCPRGECAIFEESAHYPFIEEKERFAQVIAEFAGRRSLEPVSRSRRPDPIIARLLRRLRSW
jgi:non-heme chloroperoxidase